MSMTGKDLATRESDGDSVGARIRALRKKTGKKQTALAQEAGISAAQLCHLEKDDVQPSIRTLRLIATALGIPVAELLREPAAETAPEAVETVGGDALSSDALDRMQGAGTARSESSPHPAEGEMRGSGSLGELAPPGTMLHLQGAMRKGGSPGEFAPPACVEVEPESGMWRIHDGRDTAVDRRVRARLKKEMGKWKAIERAAGVTGSPTLPLFFPAAAEHGALLARAVRTAGGLGLSAAVDPVPFLEQKGIRVLETKLPAGLDSWSLWDPTDGNAFLFLRKGSTEEKKRFRAAFELGHLVRFVSGGMRPLRDIGDSRKTSRAFAAAFLLPEEAVREAAHGLAIRPKDWTWELVLALKARFGVSAETFLYRIEELGMLSHSRGRTFRARLKERYAQCRLDGRDDFEPPAPQGAGGRPGALRIRAFPKDARATGGQPAR